MGDDPISLIDALCLDAPSESEREGIQNWGLWERLTLEPGVPTPLRSGRDWDRLSFGFDLRDRALARLRSREWLARAFRRGGAVSEQIDPAWWQEDVTLRLGRAEARWNDCDYIGVKVRVVGPAAAPVRKQIRRTDHRDADAPLVEEMIRGIESEQYKSATDAARAVVSRAAGQATDASKVRRLAGRVPERQRRAQS
jgi:hypothetical protein